MKKLFNHHFAFLLIAISISSCSLLQYVPNGQNVPLFKEKGEVAANMALSTGEQYFGFEIQSAYSFTDHIGLQVNGMVWGGAEFSQGVLFDIAPGYFFNVHENIVFEVYGGYGKGNIMHTFKDAFPQVININGDPIFVNYERYFIQPGIGYTMKNVDIAFSTRFNLMDYYGQKPVYAVPSDDPLFFNLKELDKFYTIDPALTLRFGWRHFKFQFQSVYLIPLLEEHRVFTNEFPAFYDRWNINIGFHFNFGGHYRSSASRSGKL